MYHRAQNLREPLTTHLTLQSIDYNSTKWTGYLVCYPRGSLSFSLYFINVWFGRLSLGVCDLRRWNRRRRTLVLLRTIWWVARWAIGRASACVGRWQSTIGIHSTFPSSLALDSRQTCQYIESMRRRWWIMHIRDSVTIATYPFSNLTWWRLGIPNVISNFHAYYFVWSALRALCNPTTVLSRTFHKSNIFNASDEWMRQIVINVVLWTGE